jgi:dihydrolipoamide dehydrogenase
MRNGCWRSRSSLRLKLQAVIPAERSEIVKVIFDAKTGELLGAHMVGAEVTELIQGYVVAMNAEVTEHELMETIFPHRRFQK